MSGFLKARAKTIAVLERELVGPDPQGQPFDIETDTVDRDTAWMPRRQGGSGEEILTRDSPDRRYGIGVLYSSGGRAPAEQEVAAGDGPPEEPVADADLDVATRRFQSEASAAQDDLGDESPSQDLDLSGANDFRPTTMAITFLAELPAGATLRLGLSAGRYRQRDVSVGNQTRSWWFRSACALDAEWPADALRSKGGRHGASPASENLDGLNVEAFAVSRPRDDGTSLITVGVVNATPSATANHFLFQVAFRVTVSSASQPELILPYPQPEHTETDAEEESVELLYRHYPTFAVGHGCAADWGARTNAGRCSEVWAEPLPAVETPSITPQVHRSDGSELRVPIAPLAGLIDGDDGGSALDEVVRLYERWIDDRQSEVPALSAAHQSIAARHLDACRNVASRMREGLALIRDGGHISEAFTLANRAVLLQQVHSANRTRELVYDPRTKTARLADPRRPADPLAPPEGRGAWRPFQIAFLLAAIPSCADRNHPDRELVDLIFFPTGGGKTEAYLGLSAFSAFLRRLRDPGDAGVEVLMRYTLRLLTAQQFQRAAALVCAMETIRKEQPGLGSTPFDIGIWVGGDTAPNTRKQALTDLRNLRSGRSVNPFLVIRCPWCAAQIGPLRDQGGRGRGSKGPRVLGYDESEGSVRISCTDPECEFASGLPLYVIDEDIYDRHPVIVIGTVDKFAQLAWRFQRAVSVRYW